MLGAIRYTNAGKVVDSVIPERYSFMTKPLEKGLTSFERKRLYRYNAFIKDLELIYHKDEDIPPFFHKRGSKEFIRPHAVLSVSRILGITYGEELPSTPELRSRERLDDFEIMLLQLLSHNNIGPLIEGLSRLKGFNFVLHHINQCEGSTIEIYNKLYEQYILYRPIAPERHFEEIEKPIIEQEEPKTVIVEPTEQIFGYEDYWTWTYHRIHDPSRFLTRNLYEAYLLIDEGHLNMEMGNFIRTGYNQSSRDSDLARNWLLSVEDNPHWTTAKTVWIKSGGNLNFFRVDVRNVDEILENPLHPDNDSDGSVDIFAGGGDSDDDEVGMFGF